MKRDYWTLAVILLLGMTSTYYFGCKKTDSPYGVFAPSGLDVPSMTPTPQTGAIEIYVVDTVPTPFAIQGVSINLLDPFGNTLGSNKTQPIVGYAAFNPSNLISGIWTAVVPAQSVISGTNKFTFWRSTLPIAVSGAGQYAATFSTGGNSVAISPVSQSMGLTLPDSIPITVSYEENGNLDVPVSVSLQGYPNIIGFSLTTSPNFVFGGGVYDAATTLVKNTCYYQTIPLSLSASDFSGNSVPQSGASIVKNWSIPVTLLMEKTSLNNGYEYCTIEVTSSNDCGASAYSITYQTGGSDPPGGTVYGPYGLAGGQSVPVTYAAAADPYIRAVLYYPSGGQIVGDIQMQRLSFGSFSNMGNTSY